ncbi:uncharacterized protein PFL1_01652 [Pseudozyma flocculosa PF-1]|uniref:uncharacterized protein n=1 Tax=Pseudozyma flocculosa PF-1 TaxID=1277687 RepID=UPI0004561531|nr:uncharacterized protein PFL1_01652 [Pseudozyma flocculosa PF-1]EPQ30751.1 hypothetical protein PFL1_01652 [Pseudozyma flocculosa PF-1]
MTSRSIHKHLRRSQSTNGEPVADAERERQGATGARKRQEPSQEQSRRQSKISQTESEKQQAAANEKLGGDRSNKSPQDDGKDKDHAGAREGEHKKKAEDGAKHKEQAQTSSTSQQQHETPKQQQTATTSAPEKSSEKPPPQQPHQETSTFSSSASQATQGAATKDATQAGSSVPPAPLPQPTPEPVATKAAAPDPSEAAAAAVLPPAAHTPSSASKTIGPAVGVSVAGLLLLGILLYIVAQRRSKKKQERSRISRATLTSIAAAPRHREMDEVRLTSMFSPSFGKHGRQLSASSSLQSHSIASSYHHPSHQVILPPSRDPFSDANAPAARGPYPPSSASNNASMKRWTSTRRPRMAPPASDSESTLRSLSRRISLEPHTTLAATSDVFPFARSGDPTLAKAREEAHLNDPPHSGLAPPPPGGHGVGDDGEAGSMGAASPSTEMYQHMSYYWKRQSEHDADESRRAAARAMAADAAMPLPLPLPRNPGHAEGSGMTAQQQEMLARLARTPSVLTTGTLSMYSHTSSTADDADLSPIYEHSPDIRAQRY